MCLPNHFFIINFKLCDRSREEEEFCFNEPLNYITLSVFIDSRPYHFTLPCIYFLCLIGVYFNMSLTRVGDFPPVQYLFVADRISLNTENILVLE